MGASATVHDRARVAAISYRLWVSWPGMAGGSAFSIWFDGAPLSALPGQTVGAVLWAAGFRSWRTTRVTGAPRGLFCGIGICFDCLVTIDGEAGQRACLVPARPGMLVSTGPEPDRGAGASGGVGHSGDAGDSGGEAGDAV